MQSSAAVPPVTLVDIKNARGQRDPGELLLPGYTVVDTSGHEIQEESELMNMSKTLFKHFNISLCILQCYFTLMYTNIIV